MISKDDNWWVSELNESKKVLGESFFPPELKIYDVTLRDGEQTAGLVFDKNDKLQIAKALDELGVDRIEAGMPRVSKEDQEAIELIMKADLKAEIWGFCRAVKGDIDACHELGIRSIVCEAPTSVYKMKAYGFSKQQVLDKIVDSLLYAKNKGMYVAFFAVDATRTDLEHLENIYKKAVSEGKADEVVIVDTLGVATPETMSYLTRLLREWVSVPIMTHCHNDFGMATACTMASVKAGANCAHVTINGIGEKTGNTDLAEVAFASLLYGVKNNINLKKLYGVAKLVENLSGIKISPLKPVVGENVFRRESGLAVAQLANYPPAVESYAPELLGRNREILLGKKSGKSSIEYMLKRLGIEMDEKKVEAILDEVKNLGIRKKGPVNSDEFNKIVSSIRSK